MDDMKKDIILTYSIIDDPQQLEGKEVIEVLQEIEISVNEYIKMINIIALDDNGSKKEKFAGRMKTAENKRKEYK